MAALASAGAPARYRRRRRPTPRLIVSVRPIAARRLFVARNILQHAEPIDGALPHRGVARQHVEMLVAPGMCGSRWRPVEKKRRLYKHLRIGNAAAEARRACSNGANMHVIARRRRRRIAPRERARGVWRRFARREILCRLKRRRGDFSRRAWLTKASLSALIISSRWAFVSSGAAGLGGGVAYMSGGISRHEPG